jgi:type II secretory pathway pseudopilin PulG
LSGFTLIETIGVLAIVAILAAVLLPSVVKQVDRAAWVRESGDLSSISNALIMSILTSKTIPDASGWPAAVASQMAMPVSSITTTPRGITRYFLIDPSLSIKGGGLPYTQTPSGSSTQPSSARVMFVSTIATPLKAADLAAAKFNAIWDTPVGQKPSGWTWTGNADDLRIQRVNITPLFHRLKLVDIASSSIGEFAIDGLPSPPSGVPTGGVGQDAYYLDGTFLSLCDVSGAEQARHIVTGDISFVFDDGAWRLQPDSGVLPSSLATSYGQDVDNFLASLRSSSAVKGTAQDSVAMILNLYMSAYTSWANDNPCFTSWSASSPNQAAFWAMLQQAQGSIYSTLDTVSGSKGLLK